jgi:hypothetical protein
MAGTLRDRAVHLPGARAFGREARIVSIALPTLEQVHATIFGGEQCLARERDQLMAIPAGQACRRPAAIVPKMASMADSRAAGHRYGEPATEVAGVMGRAETTQWSAAWRCRVAMH